MPINQDNGQIKYAGLIFNISTANNFQCPVLLLKSNQIWYIFKFHSYMVLLKQMQKHGYKLVLKGLILALVLFLSPDLEAQTKTRCI